jgi:hypothetical protein
MESGLTGATAPSYVVMNYKNGIAIIPYRNITASSAKGRIKV